MDDDIAIIHDHPAVTGEALLFAFFLMLGANVFDDGFGESIYHAVAGTGADNEIVSKRCDVFQVQQDDVFTLFIFQRVYDFTSKF